MKIGLGSVSEFVYSVVACLECINTCSSSLLIIPSVVCAMVSLSFSWFGLAYQTGPGGSW